MGVPAFFGWLVKRFPLIKQQVVRGECPRVDCLYLDMNGIMYRCAKDDSTMFKDLITHQNYDQLFAMIFNYINLLINLVGPKKFVFLSLDGSAPRAKMNQQRTRRFLSAKGFSKQIENLQSFGYEMSDLIFENNSISPGTDFMYNLNKQLQFFIKAKISEDAHWQNLEIVLSGSDVPGEGEHKILQYIRDWQNKPDFDPEMSHCIYGGDADLIMLGLSTHIRNFCLLREDITFGKEVSTGAMRKKEEDKFLMLYLTIIREYFDLEFSEIKDKMKIKFELNRIIDDLILIFFFLGNDFLPRCYCFDIREGNIEELIQKYKEHIVKAESYINDFGIINFKEMENLLKLMKDFEMKFIADRKNESDKELMKYKEQQQKQEKDQKTQSKERSEDDDQEDTEQLQQQTEKKEARQLNLMLQENQFLTQLVQAMHNDSDAGLYKILYYQSKLKIDLEDQDKLAENLQKLDNIMQVYIEGLQFVGLYYYKGTPSWSWYYNNYYSPLASDLYEYVKQKNKSGEFELSFSHDAPFPPIKQLLSIMHPANNRLLPESYRHLLTDMNSPLRSPIDYYPQTFDVDPYGGLYEHEFICILPFIESKLMNEVYEKLLPTLDEYSRAKNQEGKSYRFRYDPKAPPTKVKSTIGKLYNDFEVCITVEEFDVYEHAKHLDNVIEKEDVRHKYSYKRYQIPGDMSQKVLDVNLVDKFQRSLFPSLFSREIDEWKMEDIKTKKGKDKIQKRLVIKLKEEIPELKQPYHLIEKKWRWAYIGYPAGIKCEIVGWIDRRDLCVKKDETITFLSEYTREDHQHVYELLSDFELFNKNGLEVRSDQQIAFVRIYQDVRRKANGDILLNQSRFTEHYYPLQLLSSYLYIEPTPLYREIESLTSSQTPEQEFPIGDKVVVLSSEKEVVDKMMNRQIRKVDGSLARVKGIIKDPKDPRLFKLEVEVLERVSKSNSIKQILAERPEDKGRLSYFTIEFFSQKLGVHWKTLLYLLDSIEIKIDKNVPSGEKLTPVIDIGLNLVSIRRNLLTPGFIRIFQAEQGIFGYQKYKQLSKMEISEEVAQYITDYFQLLYKTNIINLIEINIRAKENKMVFTANEVWKHNDDPNIEALKIYMWLLKNPLSKPKLSGLASEVYSMEKIRKILDTSNSNDSLSKAQSSQQTLIVDPNLVHRENRNVFVPVHYRDIPTYLALGDRVVNLNTNGENSIPIGAVGTVVGILYDSFEVVFDKPFIGGDNLGQRCDILRGAVVDMEDIFNLNPASEWAQRLVERLPADKSLGWDGRIEHFVPNFQDEAIYDELVFKQQEKKSLHKSIFEMFNKWEEERKGKSKKESVPVGVEVNRNRKNSDHLSNASKVQSYEETITPQTSEETTEDAWADYKQVDKQKKKKKQNQSKQKPKNVDVYSGKSTQFKQGGDQQQQEFQQNSKQTSQGVFIKVKDQFLAEQPKNPQANVKQVQAIDLEELEKQQMIEQQRQIKYQKKKKKQSVDISQIQTDNAKEVIKIEQQKSQQQTLWQKKVKAPESDSYVTQSKKPPVNAISLEELESGIKGQKITGQKSLEEIEAQISQKN